VTTPSKANIAIEDTARQTKLLKFGTDRPIKNVPEIHAVFRCAHGDCSGFVCRRGWALA
jgi:hypothetical protein